MSQNTSNSPDSTFERLTTQPVEKLIPRLAVPCIISMMVTAIYNMADTYFVGQLEDNAASGAIGVVFSLMVIIQALGLFFGQGSGNYISRALGRQDQKNAQAMASLGLYCALIFGVLFCIVGSIFSEPLVYFMGATSTIAPHAQGYLSYILIGAPFLMGSYVLNNQLRYQGYASLAMVGIASGSILNIILDPIFIFTLDMGVPGAALATCISQTISFIILCFMAARPGLVGISPKHFHPSVSLFKDLWGGGIPSLGRQGFTGIATICLNQAAGPYGDAAIAAIGIVSRIIAFGYSGMVGFGQGFQPVCGYNYGAKLYRRVRTGFWFCVRYSFLLLTAVGILGLIFAPDLIALFRDDPQVIAYGSFSLRCQCVSFIGCCWIVPTNMMLQTIGRTGPATIVAVSRQGLFLIPAAFILAHFFGITGLLFAQSVSDIGAFILSTPFQLKALKEMSVPDGTSIES